MVGQPESRVTVEPADLGLPYPQWYDQQREALEFILHRSEHVLMLDAPTAVGKSGIAFAIPRIRGTEAYAATESRALQDQYHEDGALTIKGRANFRCEPGWEAEQLPSCEFGFCDTAERREDCPFHQQFMAGIAAPFTVLNYQVLMTYLGSTGHYRLPEREWLICDEGDSLEEALNLHLDVTVSREDIDLANFPVELPPVANKENMYRWAMSAKNIVVTASGPRQKRVWELLRSSAVKVLDTMRDPNCIVQDHDDNLAVSVKYLWPLSVVKERLFNHFNRVLIMSATMGDMDALARQMTLGPEEYATLAVDSPIPVERRLIHIVPVANLKQNAHEQEYLNMASAIIQWAEEKFPRQKGLVHVTSFKMARKLGRLLQMALGARVVIEDRRDPDIKPLWERTLGGILVTANSGRGFDRPYLFGWQVIAHLPYPSLAERVNRSRLDLDRGWYVRRTANRTVQIAGRVTRAIDDTGVTIVADSTYGSNVWKNAKDSFPGWFRDAIRWDTAAGEVQ